MKRTTHLVALAALLTLLLGACQVVGPTGTSRARPDPSSPASEELTTIRLSRRLRDLIWRWDGPDLRPTAIDRDGDDGDDDEEDEDGEGEAREFQRRFAKFCTDTGIVKPGEPVLRLEGRRWGWQYVHLPLRSRARARLLELNYAFGDGSMPGPAIVVDLLVLEVSGKLARKWGLDGLPAAEPPPAPFADGVPSFLREKEFAALRSLILKQPGSRISAAASVTTRSGETGVARHVREMARLDEASAYVHSTGATAKPAGTGAEDQAAIPGLRYVGVDYSALDPRDVGVTLTVLPTLTDLDATWGARLCAMDVEVEVSGVESWITYDRKVPIRTPLVSAFTLESKVNCIMGRTVFAGSAFRSGKARALLTAKTPPSTCVLAFLTPRQVPRPAEWPAAKNYVSPAGQLLVLDVSCLTALIAGPSTRSGSTPIDWGSDDDDDDDDDDDVGGIDWEADFPRAKPAGPTWNDDELTLKTREFLREFGVDLRPAEKLIYFDSRLIYLGAPESVREIARVFSEIGDPHPKLMVSRAVAIRVTPEVWLELMAERREEYGRSSRILNREEVRTLLRKVARDRRFEILSSAMIPAIAGEPAVLRDVVELVAPIGYEQNVIGGRSFWLPQLDEPRDVGSTLRVMTTLDASQWHVTLDLELDHTGFAGWQPLGPTLGLPQYRASNMVTQIVLDRGSYMLLGGGGGDRDSTDSFVIWLVGAERTTCEF